MIMAASMAAYAQGAPSVLSEGRWVKVKVTAEGIQQISHEQLRAWGFDDPEAVKVYGYGGTALALGRLGAGANDLPATPSLHTADGRLLFYGDADVRLDLRNFNATENLTSESGALWRRNVHDTGGYYFLSDADTGAETLAPLEAPEAEHPVPQHGWRLRRTPVHGLRARGARHRHPRPRGLRTQRRKHRPRGRARLRHRARQRSQETRHLRLAQATAPSAAACPKATSPAHSPYAAPLPPTATNTSSTARP